MRYASTIPGMLWLMTGLVACSSPSASVQASPSPTATPSPTASPSQTASPSPTASPAAASTSGGSLTYNISGGYKASGKFTLVSVASAQADAPVFDGTGWTATFAGGKGGFVLLDTRPAGSSHPSSPSIEFTDGTVIVPATEAFGCSFTLTKNDAGGLAGKVDCPATHVAYTAGGAPSIVHFSAQWNAHP